MGRERWWDGGQRMVDGGWCGEFWGHWDWGTAVGRAGMVGMVDRRRRDEVRERAAGVVGWRLRRD